MPKSKSQVEKMIDRLLAEENRIQTAKFESSVSALNVPHAVKQALMSAYDVDPSIAEMQVAIIDALLPGEEHCACSDREPSEIASIEIVVEKRGCCW